MAVSLQDGTLTTRLFQESGPGTPRQKHQRISTISSEKEYVVKCRATFRAASSCVKPYPFLRAFRSRRTYTCYVMRAGTSSPMTGRTRARCSTIQHTVRYTQAVQKFLGGFKSAIKRTASAAAVTYRSAIVPRFAALDVAYQYPSCGVPPNISVVRPTMQIQKIQYPVGTLRATQIASGIYRLPLHE